VRFFFQEEEPTRCLQWKAGDDLEVIVSRDGTPTTLNAVYEVPLVVEDKIQPLELPADDPRMKLRNAWLFSK